MGGRAAVGVPLLRVCAANVADGRRGERRRMHDRHFGQAALGACHPVEVPDERIPVRVHVPFGADRHEGDRQEMRSLLAGAGLSGGSLGVGLVAELPGAVQAVAAGVPEGRAADGPRVVLAVVPHERQGRLPRAGGPVERPVGVALLVVADDREGVVGDGPALQLAEQAGAGWCCRWRVEGGGASGRGRRSAVRWFWSCTPGCRCRSAGRPRGRPATGSLRRAWRRSLRSGRGRRPGRRWSLRCG